MLGKKFGKLTVIEKAPQRGNVPNKRWVVQCACGSSRERPESALLGGIFKSCGGKGCKKTCFGTHGRSSTNLCKIWYGMKSRCYSPTATKYHLYGAKGITICDRWLDFEKFASDMGERPSKRHTLDRIDGTKGYFPGNVRWATPAQQMANIRTNVMVTWKGKTHHLPEWGRILGISGFTLRARWRLGLRGAKLFRPVQPNTGKKPGFIVRVKKDGRTQALEQWAKDLGIHIETLRARYRSGKRGLALLAPLHPTKGRWRNGSG